MLGRKADEGMLGSFRLVLRVDCQLVMVEDVAGYTYFFRIDGCPKTGACTELFLANIQPGMPDWVWSWQAVASIECLGPILPVPPSWKPSSSSMSMVGRDVIDGKSREDWRCGVGQTVVGAVETQRQRAKRYLARKAEEEVAAKGGLKTNCSVLPVGCQGRKGGHLPRKWEAGAAQVPPGLCGPRQTGDSTRDR